MKKRFLGVLLAAAMVAVLLLPLTALADTDYGMGYIDYKIDGNGDRDTLFPDNYRYDFAFTSPNGNDVTFNGLWYRGRFSFNFGENVAIGMY